MSTGKFKKPEEMLKDKEDNVPVSARIPSKDREFLTKQAEKSGHSLALLIANILKEYTNWLREQDRKK